MDEYPTKIPCELERGRVREGVARINKHAPMITPTDRVWSMVTGGRSHHRRVARPQAQRKDVREDVRATQ